MNLSELQEMQKQQAANYGTQTNAAMGDSPATMSGLCGEGQLRRRTQREEAQYRMEKATTEAQRAARAVSFFADHPEFDEFIQLVRAGAIQI